MDALLARFIPLGAGILFYSLLLIFLIHTIFVAYHWFTYGTRRVSSLIAFAVYLSGGALCFLTMAISLGNF